MRDRQTDRQTDIQLTDRTKKNLGNTEIIMNNGRKRIIERNMGLKGDERERQTERQTEKKDGNSEVEDLCTYVCVRE